MSLTRQMHALGMALSCACLFLPPATSLQAQTAVWADLDAFVTDLATDDLIGASAALTAWREQRRLRLIGIGSWYQDTDGDWAGQAIGGAHWRLPRIGWVSPALEFDGSFLGFEESPSRSRLLARGRAHAGGTGAGAWLGAGGGSADNGIDTRGVWIGEVGGWMDAGPAVLTSTVSTTGLADEGEYTELELSAQAVLGRLSLQASTGGRWWISDASLDDEGWVEGAAAWQLDRRLALTASAGRFPSDPLRGLGRGSWVQLGVRLGDLGPASPSTYSLRREARRSAPLVPPVARDLTVESTGQRRRFTVRVRTAGPVELAGDFTDWRPVRLFRMDGDLWVVDLEVPPGSYRLNLRVAQGEWGVPPGLPIVRDDFDTAVALLVLP